MIIDFAMEKQQAKKWQWHIFDGYSTGVVETLHMFQQLIQEF